MLSLEACMPMKLMARPSSAIKSLLFLRHRVHNSTCMPTLYSRSLSCQEEIFNESYRWENFGLLRGSFRPFGPKSKKSENEFRGLSAPGVWKKSKTSQHFVSL